MVSAVRGMMLGKAAVNPVSVPSGSYEHLVADPADATCNISFNSNGSCSVSGGVNPSVASNWYTPTTASIGNTHWIRWTNTSGTLSTGTAGSWLALSAGQSFGVARTTIGNKICTGTVEIATDSGGTNIVATGSITLTADVS